MIVLSKLFGGGEGINYYCVNQVLYLCMVLSSIYLYVSPVGRPTVDEVARDQQSRRH